MKKKQTEPDQKKPLNTLYLTRATRDPNRPGREKRPQADRFELIRAFLDSPTKYHKVYLITVHFQPYSQMNVNKNIDIRSFSFKYSILFSGQHHVLANDCLIM